MTSYSRPLALIDALHPATGELELVAALSEKNAALTLLDVMPDQGWTWNMLGKKAEQIRNKLQGEKLLAIDKIAKEEAQKTGMQVAHQVASGRTGITVIKQVLA